IYYAYHNARATTDESLDEIAQYSCELLLTYFLLESKPLIGIVQNTKLSYTVSEDFNPLFEFYMNGNPKKFLEKISGAKSGMREIIKLNQYIINCLLDINDEVSYVKAKGMLFKDMNIFSKSEVYNLFSSLIGNLLRKTMVSRDKYQDEFFELMTRSLECGAY